jgi:hypothetical protein
MVAVACVVWPTATDDALSETETDATGTGEGAFTVRDAEPLTPSLEALIIVAPGASADIIPASLTLATAGTELCHATARPERGVPVTSRAVAAATCVWPIANVADGRVTESDATYGAPAGGAEESDEHAVAPNARPNTARIRLRMGMRPPVSVIRRPDWHGALARAVAS